MSDKRDLTTGPVWRAILRLAGPMVIGIVATISTGLVDTYFVGKLGTNPLAALSFSAPVTMAIVSLSIGLGAGTASVVSRAIGAKNTDEAKRLTTDSIVLAIVFVVVLSVIGYLTVKPVFSLLGANQDTLPYIQRYMQIWYLSMPLLVLPMIANAVIRSLGDSFWPSVMMVSAAVINVIATPALMLGWGPLPALDIEGVAWGTFVARLVSLIFAVWLIVYRERFLQLTLPAMQELLESWRKIITVAVPAALGNATNPIGITIVTAFIATFGQATVAAFGVATRIESFAVIPMLALSSVIGPMAGQNWGAKKIERVTTSLKVSYWACVIWAIVLALLFWLAAPLVTGLFTDDPLVQQQAALYLYIVPLSVWGYGCVIVAAGALNAIGKSQLGLASYLIRIALAYIPFSIIAAQFASSTGVFVAIALANALAGAFVAIYSLRLVPELFARQHG